MSGDVSVTAESRLYGGSAVRGALRLLAREMPLLGTGKTDYLRLKEWAEMAENAK